MKLIVDKGIQENQISITCMYSFNPYLLSAYCVPGIVLGPGALKCNSAKSSPWGSPQFILKCTRGDWGRDQGGRGALQFPGGEMTMHVLSP